MFGVWTFEGLDDQGLAIRGSDVRGLDVPGLDLWDSDLRGASRFCPQRPRILNGHFQFKGPKNGNTLLWLQPFETVEMLRCGALHSRIGCKFWVAPGATFGSCGAGEAAPLPPIPAACLGRAEQGQVSGTAHHIAHNYPTPQPPDATATPMSQLLLLWILLLLRLLHPDLTLAPYSTCCSRHPRSGLAHPWFEVAGAQVSQ